MAGHAFRAISAENRETRDHMVARLDIAHRLADFLDDSCRLVAEHRGGRMRVVAVDEMKVAVAYAACDRPQQHLAILRLVDIDIFDSERLLWPMKHGGFHRGSPCFTNFTDARAPEQAHGRARSGMGERATLGGNRHPCGPRFRW